MLLRGLPFALGELRVGREPLEGMFLDLDVLPAVPAVHVQHLKLEGGYSKFAHRIPPAACTRSASRS